MHEFVVILLPGIVFSHGAEHLMKRKLDTHYFVFLSAFNILVLNIAALALRSIIADFLSQDGYLMSSGTMDYATSLLRQALYSLLSGIPVCLAEAFLGRYLFISLDDTKKEEDANA